MSHTEGTWYGKDGQIYPEETGKTLATIPYYDKDNEEQRANTQLISAAPDLLEACKEAFQSLKQGDPAIKTIIAALNKAEGKE